MYLLIAAFFAIVLGVPCVAAPQAPVQDGLLSKLVAPSTVEDFFSNVYERKWAYFKHPEAVLPESARPTLEDVTSWASRGRISFPQQLEVLPHPKSGRGLTQKAQEGTLDVLHRAFSAGHSMVINSLQGYSETARRLVGLLVRDMGWPIDSYMYLTPPDSQSYDAHSDVMDAWMLQISGSKAWRICEPRNYAGGMVKRVKNCSNVTMSGGDAMYVPFGTVHQAITSSTYSSHLTVNIERQYYVWANILQAATVHAQLLGGKSLAPQDYTKGGGFKLEGESSIENWLLNSMREVTMLSLTPFANNDNGWSLVLPRSAGPKDVPAGYWQGIIDEWKSLAKQLKDKFGDTMGPAMQWHGKQGRIRLSTITEDSVRWAINVARVHSLEHLDGDVWLSLSAIESLSTLRSKKVSSGKAKDSLKYVRPQSSRTVVSEHDGRFHLWINRAVNGRKIDAERAKAVQFACGLFAEDSARGREFVANEVPWDGKDEDRDKFLLYLVQNSALSIVPTDGEGVGVKRDEL